MMDVGGCVLCGYNVDLMSDVARVQIHSDRSSDEGQVLVHVKRYLQDDCRCLGRFLASLVANSSHYGQL